MNRTAVRLGLLLAAIGLLAAGWLVVRVATGAPVASAAASASPDVGAEGDRDHAWWRTEATLDSVVARIGTVELGETAVVDVLAEAPIPPAAQQMGLMWIAGAVQGQVVIVLVDGDESVLLLVDAVSAERREAFRSRDVIADVEVAGPELIILTGDRLDGAPRGAWSVDVDGGEPQPIAGLVATAPDMRLAAVVEWITDLVVSRDGALASVLRCVGLECTMRTLDRRTGATAMHRLEWGEQPLSILDEVAVLEHACVDVDCDVTLLDLASGATAEIPRAGDGPPSQVTVVAGDGELLALTAIEAGGGQNGPSAFELVDLEAGVARRVVVQLAGMQVITPRVMRWGAGMELPDGSILVAGRRPGADVAVQRYFLVDVDTGAVTAVPELGERMTQG